MIYHFEQYKKNESQHWTCTLWHVCPAKIQISLPIHSVWSESSLGAFWVAKDAPFLHVDNADSDKTVWMDRLIWVFTGLICQKVHFLMLQVMCFYALQAYVNISAVRRGATLQPLYNTARYNTVLHITRFKDGSQKCIDYIEKWP